MHGTPGRENAVAGGKGIYISYLENRLENMSAMYKNLQKAHFGSKSEKQKRDILPEDCEQLSIFNEAEDAADAKANDPTSVPENTVEVKSHKRAKKRNREELLEGLPVKIHEYELPAEEMTCHRCGHALEKIGREYIRKECEYIPAQVKVHEYYRATYACRGCEDGTDECKDCERAGADNCGKCENRPGMILVKAEVPEEHRYFVTDGYAGYNKVTSGTRCGCWAHVRRKFWKLFPAALRTANRRREAKRRKALSSARSCSCWNGNLHLFHRKNGMQNAKSRAVRYWKPSGHGAAAWTP